MWVRSRFRVLSLILLLFVGAGPPAGLSSLSYAESIDIAPLETKPLTLEAVLMQVQLNHPKLQGAELERRMAAAKRLEKQGAFDPAIVIDDDTQRYNSYPTRGKSKFETLNDVSVGMLTRYGAKISASSNYHYGDVKSPASGTGAAGSHFLGLNVPLLRNARINEKAAAERKAMLGEPLANADYTQARISLLLKASNTYWEWVAARLRADVNQQLTRLASVRAEQVLKRAKSGDLPLIDAVEANQEVQRRQELLVKSQRDFQKATFSVASYLWPAGQKPMGQQPESAGIEVNIPLASQVPDQLPQPQTLTDEAVQLAKVTALKKRPELSQLALLRDVTDVDLDLARNQLLPVLDLYAGPGIDTGENSVGPLFKAGVTLVVPLRNRTARGQIEQARLKLQKLDLDQRVVVQQILLEVEDTASELNMTQQRFEAASQSYALARQLEAGEQSRFALGDSTLFLVNQRERATAEALIKCIEVQTEAQQAQARLQAVTGEL